MQNLPIYSVSILTKPQVLAHNLLKMGCVDVPILPSEYNDFHQLQVERSKRSRQAQDAFAFKPTPSGPRKSFSIVTDTTQLLRRK